MASYWFRNGDVYTLNPAQPWATSVVVHDQYIVHVGDDDGAKAHLRSDTVEVDLQGGFLMPGFVDGHDHLIGGGLAKVGVSLEGLEGKDAIIEAVRRYALDHPERDVIRGHGWTPFSFGPGVMPQRSWLDAVTDIRPALLHTYDVHDAWANTAAFILAGIDADTPDPNPPSSYWPREHTGFPAGACCEPEAWIPLAMALGMFSVEAVEDAMQHTLFPAPSWGITTAYDASPIINTRTLTEQVYERLVEIDNATGLPVRLVGSCVIRDGDTPPEQSLEHMRAMNAGYRSENFAITTMKLFMDGVGPQHTARLIEPYTDQPDNLGPYIFTPETARQSIEAANVAGFDVHLHACGDGGVRGALDAIEQVQAAHPSVEARNTVCHMELCHPDDVPRFAELGVTANGTPIWGTDYRGEFIDAYPALIGEERFSTSYLPYGSLVRSGARVTFGADCPGTEVHEIAPLKQIEAAVTRQRPGRADDRICGEHERVTLAQALQCYTINGAKALRLEDQVGSIEVGKRADIVVLQQNPFTVSPYEIHTIGIRHTLLSGRFTHGAVS